MGFAMNVAYILWRSAASRAVRLKRKGLIGQAHRIAVQQVDSICAAPDSWIRVSISISCASQNEYMSSNNGSNSLTAAIL